MIDKLVAALRESGTDLDWRDLCDTLWLAQARGPGEAMPRPSRSPTEDAAPSDALPPTAHIPQPPRSGLEPSAGPTAPAMLRRAGDAHGDGDGDGVDLDARTPGYFALPGRQEIARALWPIKRHRLSRHVSTFDADATVDHYCDTRVLIPLLTPERQQWFREIALVVDSAPTMIVWQETVRTLVELLAHHSAFERVSRWSLDGPHLLSATGVPQDPRVLANEDAQRLVLVVTDCVGPAWREDPIWALLRAWGTRLPVALVHMLPPRLWNSTALGETDTLLTTRQCGAPNVRLDLSPPWWWDEEELPVQGLPVLTLEKDSLHAWARMVMGGAVKVPGIIPNPPDGPVLPILPDPGPRQRVSAFRSTVSPEAGRLAILLSAVEISLPVAQLILRTLIPGARQTHLAELLAGGLLKRTSPPKDDPVYDFIPGVREVLQESLTTTATLDVWRAVAPYLEATTGDRAPFSRLLSVQSEDQALLGETPMHHITASLMERLGLRDLPSASPPRRRPPASANDESVSKQISSRICLLGPPGAGKGTQAQFIASHLSLPKISTSDLFRANVAGGTPLGRQAKQYMDRGDLVPDEVTIAMVRDRLGEDDARDGFLLDGFPRNVPQAETLKKILAEWDTQLDIVLELVVDEDEIVRRLSGRRTCDKCGRIWHVDFDDKQDDICDDCGGHLFQRDDDNEEAVKRRAEVYRHNTSPLVQYYADADILVGIDATGPVEEVTRRALTALQVLVSRSAVDPKPDPLTASCRTFRDLDNLLITYWRWAGEMSLRRLAQRSEGSLSRSTISSRLFHSATEKSRPFSTNMRYVRAFISACGGDENEVRRWLNAWHAIDRAKRMGDLESMAELRVGAALEEGKDDV